MGKVGQNDAGDIELVLAIDGKVLWQKRNRRFRHTADIRVRCGSKIQVCFMFVIRCDARNVGIEYANVQRRAVGVVSMVVVAGKCCWDAGCDRKKRFDDEVEGGKTHALFSLVMASLLRTAEADIPARGMETMMKIGSLKVAYLRSKGVVQNWGLSLKKKSWRKVGGEPTIIPCGLHVQCGSIFFSLERNREGNRRWQGGNSSERELD